MSAQDGSEIDAVESGHVLSCLAGVAVVQARGAIV